MAIKKGNTVIQVVLTPYHVTKLNVLQKRTGLAKTAIIRRMIENSQLFWDEQKELDKE